MSIETREFPFDTSSGNFNNSINMTATVILYVTQNFFPEKSQTTTPPQHYPLQNNHHNQFYSLLNQNDYSTTWFPLRKPSWASFPSPNGKGHELSDGSQALGSSSLVHS
jgi:hypothetical protein